MFVRYIVDKADVWVGALSNQPGSSWNLRIGIGGGRWMEPQRCRHNAFPYFPSVCCIRQQNPSMFSPSLELYLRAIFDKSHDIRYRNPPPQPLIVIILRKWTLMKKKRRLQHWSASMPMKRTRRWHFSPLTKCFTSKSTTSLRFVKNTLELQQIELQQEHFFPCAPLSRSLGMSQTRFEMRTNF